MSSIWDGFPKKWGDFLDLDQWIDKPWSKKLDTFVQEEYKNYNISPQKDMLWRAFELTDFDNVKVVILGHDPYANSNMADGLAFSTQTLDKLPGTLKNILKELKNDLGIDKNNGSLDGWAKQGVLLLNTILTTREGQSNSHKNKGWERFNDLVLKKLNQNKNNIVFVFWGRQAQDKIKLITNLNHNIIQGAHPSPNSSLTGFFDKKYFTRINEYLIENKREPIDWNL